MAALAFIQITFGIFEIHCTMPKIHEILGPSEISVIFKNKSRFPAAILENQVEIFEKVSLHPVDNSFLGKVRKFHLVISHGSGDTQQKVRGGSSQTPLVRMRVKCLFASKLLKGFDVLARQVE
jgi:hypothetical protein